MVPLIVSRERQSPLAPVPRPEGTAVPLGDNIQAAERRQTAEGGVAESEQVAEADRGFLFLGWSEGDARQLNRLREVLPNALLKPQERENFDVRLQALEEGVTKILERQESTVRQLDAMKATLGEIREASKRLGKKDLVMLGIGSFTTLALSAVFPPAVAVHAGKLFIHEVVHLFSEELAG